MMSIYLTYDTRAMECPSFGSKVRTSLKLKIKITVYLKAIATAWFCLAPVLEETAVKFAQNARLPVSTNASFVRLYTYEGYSFVNHFPCCKFVIHSNLTILCMFECSKM